MGRPDVRQQPAGVKVSKTAFNFSRLPASPGATQGMNRGEPRWNTPADCRHCALRPQAIFAALRGPDFDHISPSIRASLVPAGTEIYREDTAADAVYTIRHGIVKLIKQTPGQEARIVRLLGRSATAGLEALTHGLYWHTAVAMRQAELCRVPLAVFDELQTRSVQLADRVVGQWQQQVTNADRWLTELAHGPINDRVRRLLAVLADMEGGMPATSNSHPSRTWGRSSAPPVNP